MDVLRRVQLNVLSTVEVVLIPRCRRNHPSLLQTSCPDHRFLRRLINRRFPRHRRPLLGPLHPMIQLSWVSVWVLVLLFPPLQSRPVSVGQEMILAQPVSFLTWCHLLVLVGYSVRKLPALFVVGERVP